MCSLCSGALLASHYEWAQSKYAWQVRSEPEFCVNHAGHPCDIPWDSLPASVVAAPAGEGGCTAEALHSGSSCRFECALGFHPVGGADHVVCSHGSLFGPTLRCEPNACTCRDGSPVQGPALPPALAPAPLADAP